MQMEQLACGILAVIVAVQAAKIRLLHRAAGEIIRELGERMSQETNTLIVLNSRDRYMRRLAASLNDQLRQLRHDRQRFQQGDAELKNAITNISHDLRTPLTAINGYLQLLEREEKSETVNRYLSMIMNRTEVLKQLTEELFRYSVIFSSGEVRKEWLCVNRVLEESLASYYAALVQKGITPEVSMPGERVERWLGSSALTRIFGNIIGNALKYSDGDLSISLARDGTIVFSNTARNLTSVQVGKLFDRFYTVETGRNATGLGLSIARILTEQMGGRIAAEYKKETLFISLFFPGDEKGS